MLDNHTAPPWYKQFWPWFLIAVPIVTMFVGTILITLALDTKDTLVKDDYYKEGKAINLDLAKTQAARKLGIVTYLSISDSQIEVSFLSGLPEEKAALTLEFFHPTLSEKDFAVLLNYSNQTQTYLAAIDQRLSGKWRATLIPYHKEWRVQGTLALPQSNPILFRP